MTPDASRNVPALATLTEEQVALHEQRLSLVWKEKPGLLGVLTTVEGKRIARRYVVTTIVWFLLAGLLAGLIRLQLSGPERNVLGADRYNQVFTTHGTAMMFLFAVPVMLALGLWLVPLMVGTRNVAFPRLNALGYWTFLTAGLLLFTSAAVNMAPDTGWFSYVPLAGPAFSPGKRVDVWAQTITFTEIAALIAAVQIIITAFKMRAPGMTLNRIPVFVWAMIVTSFMVVFAMPTIATASIYLAMDRLVSTHFFNPAEGGDSLLWQHLFWFFGHPEVYIMFLPGMGILSEVVSTFSRRQVFGYPVIVLALVATGFLGFGLWVHHMFTTAVPQLGASFFTAASMLIALPTGVQITCWIITLWSGRPQWKSPMLFLAGFMIVFIIGGVTGVMLASVAFDGQVHDTYFVVAHFHYVILGGVVFPLFAGLYYWFPKFTGRMPSERLAKWHFGLLLVGVNVAFFPMHFLGFQGMPRRVYTYAPETGWGLLNLVSSLGAVLVVAAVAVFLVNVVVSWRRGPRAPANPWLAHTLEWATPSPPPAWNFTHIPVVESRDGLWAETTSLPVVTGMRDEEPEVLVTTVLDAEPDHRHTQPKPSIWPLVMAVTVAGTFIGAIYTPWALPWGLLASLGAAAGWGWPRNHQVKPEIVEISGGRIVEVTSV